MSLREVFESRFGDPGTVDEVAELEAVAGRGSCRHFTDRSVPAGLVRALCATALAAPSKSDLQQRDILVVTDSGIRRGIEAACGQDWIAGAPVFLVFLANHRRQRRLADLHDLPFGNDHADAPFNAAMDAAIAMATCVAAAERAGLGACPVSTIRNRPEDVAELLGLPDRVFPAMGLALGWPKFSPRISMRLPLAVTVHENRFDDAGEEDAVRAYSRVRAARQPFSAQRRVDEFGESADYGWSEDKARQYVHPDRAGWGAYLRSIGLSLT
ncbi:MAG: nitroreductase family protein [Pseudomonadota bacterium]